MRLGRIERTARGRDHIRWAECSLVALHVLCGMEISALYHGSERCRVDVSRIALIDRESLRDTCDVLAHLFSRFASDNYAVVVEDQHVRPGVGETINLVGERCARATIGDRCPCQI